MVVLSPVSNVALVVSLGLGDSAERRLAAAGAVG